jgi:hypothetical protein
VRFRSEVDDAVDKFLFENISNEFAIADVSVYEPVIRTGRYSREVAWVSGVGECVEHHHLCIWMLRKPIVNEVSADKTSPARNE